MEEHHGYPKHAVECRNHGNSRNGTWSETVITEIGPVEIDVPRDGEAASNPRRSARTSPGMMESTRW
jgi:transposase-like protein